MFDTYKVNPNPPNVHVFRTENRAPTDASLSLLKEMRTEIENSIVESLRIENNSVTAVVHRYKDYLNNNTYFKIHYVINGKSRECDITVKEPITTITEKLKILWEVLAKDIAKFLLEKHLKGI